MLDRVLLLFKVPKFQIDLNYAENALYSETFSTEI